MADDIFSLVERESGMRLITDSADTIDLATLSLEPFIPSSDYRVRMLHPTADLAWITAALTPLVRSAEKRGFPAGIEAGLYEALLNAYQHGNNADAAKPLGLATRMRERDLDVVVMDAGGRIDPRFAAYVLLHRSREPVKIPDFYTFSGREQKGTHHGVGTRLMHVYFDKVSYYRSSLGGLAVHLLKSR
jgi:anti-sigma regulatory factor (Ser/Thr protein kinase)